jgi:hypothetical protein
MTQKQKAWVVWAITVAGFVVMMGGVGMAAASCIWSASQRVEQIKGEVDTLKRDREQDKGMLDMLYAAVATGQQNDAVMAKQLEAISGNIQDLKVQNKAIQDMLIQHCTERP